MDCDVSDATEKEYDFAYVCLPGPWKEMTKNWLLAKVCLERLCYGLNLKGLLLGRWQILDLPFRHNLAIEGDFPQERLLDRLRRCRMLFVPSVMDASPRILTEALCLDVPILVNRQILGGWKYVNASTGAFFDDEDNVLEAARRCLERDFDPRRWFQENYGPGHASARLAEFLRQLDPRFDPAVSPRLAREVSIVE